MCLGINGLTGNIKDEISNNISTAHAHYNAVVCRCCTDENMNEYILSMDNITKKFPGVVALNDVSIRIKRGEVHALCGENGAGKSTLMKVLGGVYPYKSYSGGVVINGHGVQFTNTRASEKAGIAIIYQELALVKGLDVAENIFLGKLGNAYGIVNWDTVYYKTEALLSKLGLDTHLQIDSKIADIGIGQQQLVEIAKALAINASILVLDEPTAALTEAETGLLFNILNTLKAKGVTCILVSHKLNELFAIADRITILRDGSSIGTYDIDSTTEQEVVRLMVGRELTQYYPPRKKHQSTEVVFSTQDFSVLSKKNKTKQILHNITFHVHRGEILGIAGLIGAGRTELLTNLFGFTQDKNTGEVRVRGEVVHIRTPHDAISLGIGIVPEDRKRHGLILIKSIVENITLASLKQISKWGLLDKHKEVLEARAYAQNMKIKAPSMETITNNLSGGNQQKVLLARSLMTKPDILLLDEPTRGIDVGAKYEIYTLMNQLAEQGTAIVMVSSELPEVLGMSDRILVMREGEIRGSFSREEATQEKIMTKASGGIKR